MGFLEIESRAKDLKVPLEKTIFYPQKEEVSLSSLISLDKKLRNQMEISEFKIILANRSIYFKNLSVRVKVKKSFSELESDIKKAEAAKLSREKAAARKAARALLLVKNARAKKIEKLTKELVKLKALEKAEGLSDF